MLRSTVAFVILLLVLAVHAWMLWPSARPDFSALPPDGTRQSEFVAHLCPFIEAANQAVRGDLARLENADEETLVRLAEAYGLSTDVQTDLLRERLASRVGELPPALVLAQAALESGWGTSRLAVEANNLFGRRCFYADDCYEVETQSGARIRYRRFEHYGEAVDLYFDDLNRLLPYLPLRLRRLQAGGDPMRLADGLVNYSTRAQAYVADVKYIMRANSLVGACARLAEAG